MGHVNRSQEDFTTGRSGLLGVSPSGIFGRVAWPNCQFFINCEEFL